MVRFHKHKGILECGRLLSHSVNRKHIKDSTKRFHDDEVKSYNCSKKKDDVIVKCVDCRRKVDKDNSRTIIGVDGVARTVCLKCYYRRGG